MSQQSTIAQLDPRIVEEVDRIIRSGRFTTDSLVEAIKELGGEASRSAVGRYVVKKKKSMELYAEAREMMTSLATRFREDPESNVSRGLGQVLQGITYVTMEKLAENGEAKPSELMLISTALKNIAGAEKISWEQSQRIRKQAREEAMKEAAAVVKEAQKSVGLSDESAEILRRKILGLPPKP